MKKSENNKWDMNFSRYMVHNVAYNEYERLSRNAKIRWCNFLTIAKHKGGGVDPIEDSTLDVLIRFMLEHFGNIKMGYYDGWWVVSYEGKKSKDFRLIYALWNIITPILEDDNYNHCPRCNFKITEPIKRHNKKLREGVNFHNLDRAVDKILTCRWCNWENKI